MNKLIEQTIHDIYEASYRPEHWEVVLKRIADITESSSVTFLFRDNEIEQAFIATTYNLSTEALQEYNERFGLMDPSMRLCAAKVPTGTAIADRQMASSRDKFFEICGEEYKNYLLRYGAYHIAGAHIFDSPQQTASIGIQRSENLKTWTDEELQRLTDLIPHIQRAFTIHKEFTRIRMREQALQTGMDKLLMGFVLFNELLQPIYTNPIAESILDSHPAIDMRNNMLYAYNKEDTQAIRKGLLKVNTINKEIDNPENFTTALGLNAPGRTPLPLMITPVKQSKLVPLQSFDHAHIAVLISDTSNNQPIVPSALESAYGLTKTEAIIAIEIANGLSSMILQQYVG